MNKRTSYLFASVAAGLIGAAAPAWADAAPADAAASAAAQTSAAQGAIATNEDTLAEVVVTARRRKELLEDVPITVAAVPGDELRKLNLYQYEDLSKVVPDLLLSRAGNTTSLRGVSFNPIQGSTAGVATYLNEAPVNSAFVFNSMFDVGQVEVLKGPQGTLRGVSAPTGAITIGTRRPVLDQFGGDASLTTTDQDGHTFQGAVNVPIFKDKLAIRVAAIQDRNNNGGVDSVNDPQRPYSQTDAYRISALAKPIDDLTAFVTYQRLDNHAFGYGGAVIGSGFNGAPVAQAGTGYARSFTAPAGYNGPVLNVGDDVAVMSNGNFSKSRQEIATAQIDYHFAGQVISYVGGWSGNYGNPQTVYNDVGNQFTGGDFPTPSFESRLNRWTHELRVSSDQPIHGIFDYVAGVFHSDERGTQIGNNGWSFLPGAFGTPTGAPSVATSPNLRYATSTLFDIETHNIEWSYFAHFDIHIDDKTELAAGVRFVNYKQEGVRLNTQTAGVQALTGTNAATCANGSPGFPPFVAATPGGGTFGTTYPGVCDSPVAGSLQEIDTKSKSTPVLWSASLSHKFFDDTLAYVSYGTSFRPGPSQGQIVNPSNDPLLTKLVQMPDEHSKSFEVGLKSSLLDHHLSVNLSYFHQNYTNLSTSFFAIPYLINFGPTDPRTRSSLIGLLTAPIDAKVDGIDFDFNYVPNRNFNLGGGLSWANGRYNNQSVPCASLTGSGTNGLLYVSFLATPLFQAAGKNIGYCLQSGKSSPNPTWNANLRAEYSHPVTDAIEGYMRGLLNYTPKNPYGDPTYTTPAYTTVNLYLGARNPGQGWEAEVYAKNLFNDRTVIDNTGRDVTNSALSRYVGNSGYTSISYVLPREVGLTVRYSFGSR
jgi:iron complex outermembrane receptor protein